MAHEPLDLPFALEHSHPTHWFNNQGLQMRLQVFVIARDPQRRIAVVRERDSNTVWKLPGETVQPNEDINAAAKRVSKLWFGTDLPARPSDIITFPDTGDKRWYLIFVYETQVKGPQDLHVPPDTEEVRFVEPGKAPGPWGLDHGSVFARLAR